MSAARHWLVMPPKMLGIRTKRLIFQGRVVNAGCSGLEALLPTPSDYAVLNRVALGLLRKMLRSTARTEETTDEQHFSMGKTSLGRFAMPAVGGWWQRTARQQGC